MRIWLSGPRLFNGLVRPGISFALRELRKKPSRAKRGGEPAPAPELAAPAPASAEHIPLHARLIAWIVYGFAIYGSFALVGCVGGSAHAGTCRVFQDGGFERYPGQGGRPVFERRD